MILSPTPENGLLTVHKTRYDKHDLHSPAGENHQLHPTPPNFLFEAPSFKPLSNEGKVLYALYPTAGGVVPQERLGG